MREVSFGQTELDWFGLDWSALVWTSFDWVCTCLHWFGLLWTRLDCLQQTASILSNSLQDRSCSILNIIEDFLSNKCCTLQKSFLGILEFSGIIDFGHICQIWYKIVCRMKNEGSELWFGLDWTGFDCSGLVQTDLDWF